MQQFNSNKGLQKKLDELNDLSKEWEECVIEFSQGAVSQNKVKALADKFSGVLESIDSFNVVPTHPKILLAKEQLGELNAYVDLLDQPRFQNK